MTTTGLFQTQDGSLKRLSLGVNVLDMRERLKVFLYLSLYWLLLMVVARALFLSYNHDLTAVLTAGDVAMAMLRGLHMDASMAGYCLALSGLLLTASILFRGSWIRPTLAATTLILLVLSSIIIVVDLELYRHWGFRLNTTPFFYMGSEAMGSIQALVVMKELSIFALLVTAFSILYYRWIQPHVRRFEPATRQGAWALFALSALMFIPIRGSFSVAPMNTGFVFFHKTSTYANHSAINVIWGFMNSVMRDAIIYPEDMVDAAQAARDFARLYPTPDSTTYLFKEAHPNIILIILESFTADVVEPLGGRPGIAPRLSQLCHEGVLFDQFYASGDRTDKGIVSILSGYPAQPATSIIKYPAKTQRLPHLNAALKQLGYRSSFIYGGDVDFANFRSYLTNGAFDHITSVDDFEADIDESKWGLHDHYMFAQAMRELDTTRAPFFKTLLTLSSHEPFDVPMKPLLAGQDEETLFLNACHYTDSTLGAFIDHAKQQPWWANTVVIITADHGHRHPGNKSLQDKARFKIPLLMVGGAVRQDTVIHTLSGQTDIAQTLLSQLHAPSADFRFSKNILAHNVVPFAVYYYNDGFGFISPGKFLVYDNAGHQFSTSEGASAQDRDLALSYEQILYIDYNKR